LNEGHNTSWQALREWIDRDLYEYRPASTAFAILPLGVMMLAREFAPGTAFGAAVQWVGFVAFTGWLLFVYGVSIRRRFAMGFSPAVDPASGETPCPVCAAVLPAFEQPGDETYHDFRGWTCATCGALVDRHGREITL